MTSIAEYRSSRELFSNLTLRELRSKYKRSLLGWVWSTVNPLAIMLVYTIVFTLFFRVKYPPAEPSGLHVYALTLLCGLLPWNFFQSSVNGSIGSLIQNANLIKKTYFPRELLPASAVAANIVSHLIEMSLLIIALLAFGNYRLLLFLPFVVLLTALMAIFALGLGLFLGSINVYFRDIQHFMSILFMIWLYLTPIIYPISIVPAKFVPILKLNPMTDAVLSYRAVLYEGRLPGWVELSYFVAWAIGSFVVGRLVFNKLEAKLAEEL